MSCNFNHFDIKKIFQIFYFVWIQKMVQFSFLFSWNNKDIRQLTVILLLYHKVASSLTLEESSYDKMNFHYVQGYPCHLCDPWKHEGFRINLESKNNIYISKFSWNYNLNNFWKINDLVSSHSQIPILAVLLYFNIYIYTL